MRTYKNMIRFKEVSSMWIVVSASNLFVCGKKSILSDTQLIDEASTRISLTSNHEDICRIPMAGTFHSTCISYHWIGSVIISSDSYFHRDCKCMVTVISRPRVGVEMQKKLQGVEVKINLLKESQGAFFIFPVSFPSLYVFPVFWIYPCRDIIKDFMLEGMETCPRFSLSHLSLWQKISMYSTKRSRSRREFTYILPVGNLQNAPCEWSQRPSSNFRRLI